MARALWRMLEAQAVLDRGESSQEFTVGVRRDKACPPLASPPLPSPCQKRGRRRASPCRRGTRRIVPISLPLYQAQGVSSQTFCCVYHMRFGLSSLAHGDANFVTFWFLSERDLTSFCHSPPFSPPPLLLYTAIDWLADIKTLSSWQKLHLNPQYFASVFQAAAVSHINARHDPRQTELNWSALFTLYIDKMSLLFKRRSAIGVVNRLLHPLGKITLKRVWMKMAVLSSHFVLERREEARFF